MKTAARREFDGTGLPAAIRFLAAQTKALPPDEDDGGAPPIFLLSAGWRCGSTLVQRLITSDPSVLMWGEPFEDHGIMHRLAQTVELFGPADAHLKYSIERYDEGTNLSSEWIANMNPGAAALRQAHRAFFDGLLAAPALERGYRRWGCKTVRVNAYHAHYLRWLYPRAKFVFLVRHPLNSLSSYSGRKWYFIRPRWQVRHSRHFLAVWKKTAESFLAEREALSALLVRYEDLVTKPQAVDALAGYLGISIDRDVLKKKVGTSGEKKQPLGRTGRLLLSWQVGNVCRRLGYDTSGEVMEWPQAEPAAPITASR